jgi:LysM repeat protein
LKAGMILNLQEHRKRGENIPMVPAQEYRRIVEVNNSPTVQPTASQTPPPAKEQPVYQPAQPSQPTSAPKVSSTTRHTHTVVQGETLYRLSQTYGVSVDDIKKWNNLLDNNIKIGQKITIIKP